MKEKLASTYAAYYNANNIDVDEDKGVVDVCFLKRVEAHDVFFAESVLWELGVRTSSFKLVITGPSVSDEAVGEIKKLNTKGEQVRIRPLKRE